MPLYRDFLTIILWKSHFQSSCYKDSCCTFEMWGPLLGISATHLTPNGKGRKVLRQWGQDEGRGLLVFAFGYNILGFLGGSAGKESVCNVGELGLIPGLRRSPGEGNGNPLQYSCLENPMDRGTWWATVHGVAKESDTTEHAHMTKYKILFGLNTFWKLNKNKLKISPSNLIHVAFMEV